MSPKACYASTHRMPFSETSTQNKGLFGTPGVKGSLLSLRSIPYAYTWCRHPSSQHTKCPVTIFSKQFGESLEHWTDSSVAVALKGRSHMFAIFSQALSWSEASFRRDVPSTPWSFPRSWPLLTSFHLLALAQVAVGPFKWIHYHTHFHWKDTDCIIQSMNFPAPHVDGIRRSWHGNFGFFFGLCHCIPVISTWQSEWSDWKRYENTNSMSNTRYATMAPQT